MDLDIMAAFTHDALDYTLQKYAQITRVRGKDGYWVHIDPSEEALILESGALPRCSAQPNT
jgi:hypothetical protein